MMKEMIGNKVEAGKSSLMSGEKFSVHSPAVSNNYSLKEQLENLIGPVDFSYRLEAVNIMIGIILSSLLLLFFFI